jgi:hypothetical protein
VQADRAGGREQRDEPEDDEGHAVRLRLAGMGGEQAGHGIARSQRDGRHRDAEPGAQLHACRAERVGVAHLRLGDVAEAEGGVGGQADRAGHPAEQRDGDDHRQRRAGGEGRRGRHRDGGGRGRRGQHHPEAEAVHQGRGRGLDADVADEDEQHDGAGLDRAPAEDILEQQRQQERGGAHHDPEQRPAPDRGAQRLKAQHPQVNEGMLGPQQVPDGRGQEGQRRHAEDGGRYCRGAGLGEQVRCQREPGQPGGGHDHPDHVEPRRVRWRG